MALSFEEDFRLRKAKMCECTERWTFFVSKSRLQRDKKVKPLKARSEATMVIVIQLGLDIFNLVTITFLETVMKLI